RRQRQLDLSPLAAEHSERVERDGDTLGVVDLAADLESFLEAGLGLAQQATGRLDGPDGVERDGSATTIAEGTTKLERFGASGQRGLVVTLEARQTPEVVEST